MRPTQRIMFGLLSFVVAAGSTRAMAQDHPVVDPDFPARCFLSDTPGSATVTLRACNNTPGDLFGITARPLFVSSTGTAGITYETLPGFRLEMDDGNCHTMKWQLGITGCGTLNINAEATAETPDGLTIATGEEDCGRIVIPCLNPTATRTPIGRATARPTRTPIPTATPRIRLDTPTPRITVRLPTATPRTRAATPTRGTINSPTPRPRFIAPTPTPRTRLATPTARPRVAQPTLRPTRTPLPTAGPSLIDLSLFSSRCVALNPDANQVTVFLQLSNFTGGDILDIVPCAIEIDTTGSAVVTQLAGPFPSGINVLHDGHTSRFSWNIRTSGTGEVFIHACASGVTEDGSPVLLADGTTVSGAASVATDRMECNTINVPGRIIR